MFGLRFRFVIASAVVTVMATVILMVIHTRLAVHDLLAITQEHNLALSRSFSNAIGPHHHDFLRSVTHADGNTLRAHPEVKEIHTLMADLAKGLPVLAVEMYNPGGIRVFSSDPAQIGGTELDNPGFLKAAYEGLPASDLVFSDQVNSFAGIVTNRDMVTTYLPLTNSRGSVQGVFALYTDVTPVLARTRTTTAILGGSLLGVMALLYGLILLLTRRHSHAPETTLEPTPANAEASD